MQTEAPPRIPFTASTNAWIIHDAYHQDLAAQQQKIQQQALINNASEAAKQGGPVPPTSVATATLDLSSTSGPTATTPAPAASFLLQQSGETVLSPAGISRLDSSAHVIERMLNQNTYDDIAQGTGNKLVPAISATHSVG